MSKLWIEGGIRAPQNPGGGLNIDNWSFALVKNIPYVFFRFLQLCYLDTIFFLFHFFLLICLQIAILSIFLLIYKAFLPIIKTKMLALLGSVQVSSKVK